MQRPRGIEASRIAVLVLGTPLICAALVLVEIRAAVGSARGTRAGERLSFRGHLPDARCAQAYPQAKPCRSPGLLSTGCPSPLPPGYLRPLPPGCPRPPQAYPAKLAVFPSPHRQCYSVHESEHGLQTQDSRRVICAHVHPVRTRCRRALLRRQNVRAGGGRRRTYRQLTPPRCHRVAGYLVLVAEGPCGKLLCESRTLCAAVSPVLCGTCAERAHGVLGRQLRQSGEDVGIPPVLDVCAELVRCPSRRNAWVACLHLLWHVRPRRGENDAGGRGVRLSASAHSVPRIPNLSVFRVMGR